jgi:hypothetical protein
MGAPITVGYNMSTVGVQIQSADQAICSNIELLAGQRALLSQNVLAQLRNLVEGVAVLLHAGSSDADFNYLAIEPALAHVKRRAKLNFLGKFHRLIQQSASHYTVDGDASERLMLKYYEYLIRIRILLQEDCGMSVLRNLEDFPVDLDPSLKEYHEKIASRIEVIRSELPRSTTRDRFYIHSARPFVLDSRIYYEVTLYRAINKVSKFDRITAFTNIDITDKYAAMVTLQPETIDVLDQSMPIMIIREWVVSIRPCEVDNFARLLRMPSATRTNSPEYRYLMQSLTESEGNLLDLVDMPDDDYDKLRAACIADVPKPQIFPLLDEARHLITACAPGHNILRYLLLRMNNQILKQQYNWEACSLLSGKKLKYGCIPFDRMPFCTSLPGHNPRYWDLVESLSVTGRNHELLARHVRNNVEQRGLLYTPATELEEYGDVDKLIATYNSMLYYKHTERRLVHDKGHVFICEYENDTVTIITELQKYASFFIDGYTQAVQRWLDEAPRGIDDPAKRLALTQLFSQSCLALIYGAAGTGKSTMINHLAHYFNDKRKLFLAHTNPAVDNLKRKVTAQNSEFSTISSQIGRRSSALECDLLVIDECSTVSNADMIEVLAKTSFKLLVLVGDVYQIESIQFGNWFEIVRAFIPESSVFELATPFRAKSQSLLGFWNTVRAIGDDIAEVMARNGYSRMLDKSLLKSDGQDEIILCLNYDGLYGINNINRFLQSSNHGKATTWRVAMYKIGDPVLFFETERFRPVIYNNLKGWIVGIEREAGRVQFDIKLDRPLTQFDVTNGELEWRGESIVRFSVYEYDNTSDEDDDSLNTTVPFQVAYAVSIHKAQGLEYDSVKIVITDDNEDDITHNIFYTAVTRTRDRLRIFWSPESQQAVVNRFRGIRDSKDVALIASRRGLKPVIDL